MSSADPHVLSTKLRAPRGPASAIERPRLAMPPLDALPKVVLIVAAAGFGKTTLIRHWHQQLGGRAVWLSLDRDDQDLFVFLRHLIAGFNRVRPVISAATASFVEGRVSALDSDEITIRIANDLDRLDDDRVLFLDDYHLAETPALNDLVHQLIERSPARLHVVIASRVAPALPVARYRGRNALLELGTHALTFNRHEADAFLAQVRGLRLAPRELDLLLRHTEGWGAGLHLATLFLKDRGDARRAILGLSGDTRDIADYLATEVVRRQPPAIEHFLLHSSILDRLNADVCNALLGIDDAQAMIEQVETLGLFLLPLDARRHWYRYHHLFRDFLRAQLRRRHPDALPALYRKASLWFADAGLQEDAVDMALDADDFDQAAMLVERFAVDMIKRGHIPQVARWIQRFPPQVLEQNPRLPLYQCWAVAHMAQVQLAEALLQRVEAAADTLCQGDDASRRVLEAEIHTLRAIVALMADDIGRAHALSSVRFPDTPPYHFLSGCLANVAGLVALARSEFAPALASAGSARHFHARSACSYGICYSHCISGLAEQAQGRLSDARTQFLRALDVAVHASGEHSFNAAMPRVLMAVLHYETNALDDAYAILENDLPLVDECAYVDIRTGGFVAMAGILGARGQVAAALAHLDQAVTIPVESAFERTCALAHSESIRLRLLAGDVAGARRFARHSGIDDGIALPMVWSRPAGLRAISQCRLLIAEGHADAAIAPLQALASLARDATRRARRIQILSLLVVALAQIHRHDAALATARRILALGAEQGFLRSILDQGPAAGGIFVAFARERGGVSVLSPIEADYLARICAAVGEPVVHTAMPFPAGTRIPFLVNGVADTLTGRELKVLRLLAEGASNLHIGATLFISVNTVRWHVANILGKLQVENRTQAAAAARELGLAP
ncbi:LuxR C-terminal-related transcriptional regulator [Pseudoxanthomonas sp.]|jgi:LuxR family maltose regulon positive regulatory protein|uniref:LuxR C-terminal-related transcriptional regulator n=1 Tax=Pseudoxanthomonas sp. TaxID=1871049 RepID=UPI002E1568ED|nr:LuxR C-terminal-related transcriptional regulator [Pseudoxanthomonas sp.]